MTRKTQNMKKIAVDQAAVEYYTTYFKDYGKLWVREIPRKVHARLAAIVRKSASSTPTELSLIGRSLPLYGKRTTEGGLIIEGVFKGHGSVGKKKFPVARMFVATFDGEGNITQFEDTDISAVVQAA